MPDSHTARNKIIAWVLVALWACVIFFMSANTSSGLHSDLGLLSSIYQRMQAIQESIFGPGVDVLSPIAHFCEYLVFGCLLNFALSHHVSLKRACLFAIALASLYGISDEFHQYFVPERVCDPVDWLVDTAGASLGSALTFLVLRRVGRNPEKQPLP